MDVKVWQNIITGDKNDYSDLYIEYFKKCYNYGRKFTTDEALIEDCIQELFLDIWSRKENLPTIVSLHPYLFSSFRYILLKKLKQKKLLVKSTDFTREPEFSIEFAIINNETNKELQQRLQSALNTLTSHQREVIFFRFYEGLSYEQIASVLKISIKATYKIIARSLKKLKDKMLILLILLLFISLEL